MTRSSWTAAGLACTAALLAGCATTSASSQTPASSPRPAGVQSQASPSPAPSTSGPTSPSLTAQMVCGPQIQGSVSQALKLTKLQPPKPTWRDSLYSCVYKLPVGPMTLSVKQSTSDQAASAYFTQIRPSFGATKTMIGLGTESYGTTTGIVVVVKDDKTLVVDATKLPAVFGNEGQKRTDFAYEIASDVMGCWTGSDYGSTTSG